MNFIRKLRWWADDYAYAGYWQIRGLFTRTPGGQFHNGTQAPVVVLPGIYESWQFMLPLIEEIHARGHPVHVITALRRNRRPIRHGAGLLADYLASHDLQNVRIVAHSKGGMIGKYAMLVPDSTARIDRMVAICSPFSGSRYGRFLVLPSLRAFSPKDALTLRLASEEAVNARITSIFGVFDPHIPEGSSLPGARNIQLDVGGHFRILGLPETVRTVLAAL